MLAAVKAVDADSGLIEGLAIPYGGPFQGRDLDGERFTPDTDLCLKWFDRIPLVYQHGLDGELQTEVVGYVDRAKTYKSTDEGGWVQAQLDTQHRYFEAINQLVQKGKLFFSSGAMAHLVQTDASKAITRWPWVELSLTPTPANLLARLDFATAEKHFKSAALDVPDDVKAELSAEPAPDAGKAITTNDGPGDDDENAEADAGTKPIAKRPAGTKPQYPASEKSFKAAYYSGAGEGSYEDLIQDLTRLLNPRSPFTDGAYSYVVETYPEYLIACRCDYGDDDEPYTYWRVAYLIGPDGEPRLVGEPQQVEPAFVPVEDDAGDLLPVGSLGLQATTVERLLGAFTERTKGLGERRTKEGRVLSTPNRSRISETLKRMREACDSLDALLAATEPKAKASGVAWVDQDADDAAFESLRLYAAILED